MWWNQYIGRPFAEKGRGPDSFDCWGLLRWVYQHDRHPSVILPGYDEFYKTTNDRETISGVIFDQKAKFWNEVETPDMFDAILLRMRGVPMHVGIVTKPGHMLHCAHGTGTTHEPYNSIRWRSQIIGFYHYD